MLDLSWAQEVTNPGAPTSTGGNTLSKIDELKTDVEGLSSEEAAELFRWFSERQWESWDKEIEADSEAGRLDFLIREARQEKAKGTLREM